MSISSEEGLNLFPDDMQVRTANSDDMRRLREQANTVLLVTGSDALANAACYKAGPQANTDSPARSHCVLIESRADDSYRDSGDSYPIRARL